jgi:flagellar motor switch protein FliG
LYGLKDFDANKAYNGKPEAYRTSVIEYTEVIESSKVGNIVLDGEPFSDFLHYLNSSKGSELLVNSRGTKWRDSFVKELGTLRSLDHNDTAAVQVAVEKTIALLPKELQPEIK